MKKRKKKMMKEIRRWGGEGEGRANKDSWLSNLRWRRNLQETNSAKEKRRRRKSVIINCESKKRAEMNSFWQKFL